MSTIAQSSPQALLSDRIDERADAEVGRDDLAREGVREARPPSSGSASSARR